MVKKAVARGGKTKQKILTREAQFEFPGSEAKEVYLVGEFNHWDTHANKMKKDESRMWRTTLSLKPGRYEYRFLVDGNWENTSSCSDYMSQTDLEAKIALKSSSKDRITKFPMFLAVRLIQGKTIYSAFESPQQLPVQYKGILLGK